MERAGTGGALFRNLYRDFLAECHVLLQDSPSETRGLVDRVRDLFSESALLWTRAAEAIERAGVTGNPEQLAEASQVLEEIAAIETSAMTTLRSLGGAQPE